MGQYSNYDFLTGLERVILIYVALTIALLGVLSLQLYRSLEKQDSLLIRGTAADIYSQALVIAKRAILWVFGYKGEERERTPFSEVDIGWVNRYRFAIIFRLLPVYGLYILALVVLTRPIFLDENGYHVFNYSRNLHELFAMLVIYVSSNILFDYFSLKFTLSCVMQALETKRYTFFLIRSGAFAVCLFLLAQVVSCILWVYKREDPSFPKFDNSMLHNFLEIATWPYAFVTGPGSAQITSSPFPGQLLITGTVFIPTIMVVSLFIVFSMFLKLTEAIKKLLLLHQLDRLCRLFVRVRLIGVFENSEKVKSFGYCNLAFLALLDLSLVLGVGRVVARIF
jgi:hypothetical protein